MRCIGFRRIGLVLGVAVACAILVAAALAARGRAPAKHHRVHARVVHARSAHARRAATVRSARPARSAQTPTAATENTPGDPDNVQQGDQAGAEDNPGATGETETNGESPGDIAEAGQPGEPPAGQGHADTGADVNHECTGDCVE
jgi:hypothetical protein